MKAGSLVRIGGGVESSRVCWKASQSSGVFPLQPQLDKPAATASRVGTAASGGLSQRDVHSKRPPEGFQRPSSYTNRSLRCTSASRRLSSAVRNLWPRLATMTRQPCLSSGTTASDMRAARLPESNNSSEMSQLKSTLEMRFLATLAPSVFCSRRRESRCGAN